MNIKLYFTIFFTIFFYLNVSPQNINSIKTDKDCLKFLREKMANPIFEFDTSFSSQFFVNKMDKAQHKYWGIADLNFDNNPDLYFVGETKAHKSYMRSSEASVYMSNKEGKYEFVDLIKSHHSCCFTPKIIFKKKLNKNILCVYLCSNYGIIDRDSINVLKERKYPEYVKWVDSLIFLNNVLTNYYSNPSKVKFDSLEYNFHSGWFDSDFKLKIYKNGKCFLKPNGSEFSEINFDKRKFKLLQDLIYGIDFKSIRFDYSDGGTDQNSAHLKIYSKENMFELKDYGMQSNFTLMSAYQIFFKLRQRLN